MTDLEKFIELYRSVGIELDSVRMQISINANKKTTPMDVLTLQAHGTPGVYGNHSFMTQLYFDADGTFAFQKVWK